MKKLLILFLMLASTGIFAQGTWEVNNTKVGDFAVYTMDADTSWTLEPISANYIMAFGGSWTGADATDATFSVYYSVDNGATYQLSTLPVKTLGTASSGILIQDVYYVNVDKVKITLDTGTNTTGTFTLNVRFIR